ncbi:hypothetical protein BDB00DRAFT_403258 [Zychaea mexicana]|uniref:uncharacterized protein n=1 Tax=Zychaea mexicana TaxID=64656 RepID=UPI0022FDF9FD|nr:uncharacterized protein BDB00DRAFT_403258 [Zychaea mexicana]KAI9498784.1 hypothetical protein BDB00DRAFT_403258 [Zychaea mexicana]
MAFQIPTTANAPEDVLLEFCKQLTWECTLVKGAKKRNRSWPQVIPFNNLVPYLFQAPASVRNTYFASLEKYGDFTRFFKFHAPGRNRELNDTDNWQSFESWGYELVPSQEAYLQDERYADGIFPKIHRAGPLDYLLVMYPPYFAAAFELVDQEALKKKQLEDDIKVQRQSHLSTQYAKSALSTPANFASTTTMSATSNNSNRNAATGSATTSRFTVAQATGLKNDSYTIPRNHMVRRNTYNIKGERGEDMGQQL